MEVRVERLEQFRWLTGDAQARALAGRDLLSLRDLSSHEIERVLDLAALLKSWQRAGVRATPLAGRTLAMVFMKPSTRTRVSFEVAMFQLGGHALALSAQELQLSRGETIEDTGRVMSRYVDAIMIRTHAHQDVIKLAGAATVPVINGLTDYSHPVQGLADLLTIRERFGRLRGIQLAYVGDGNNVARSLVFGGAIVGMHVSVASPAGYELDEETLTQAARYAAASGGSLRCTGDPGDAVKGADVVYTDVWVSMGQEEQRARRIRDLAPYQVNAALLSRASPAAAVMHCLPAHRGEEITDDVLDGPQAAVWDQAENRLHAQKAVLALLMGVPV